MWSGGGLFGWAVGVALVGGFTGFGLHIVVVICRDVGPEDFVDDVVPSDRAHEQLFVAMLDGHHGRSSFGAQVTGVHREIRSASAKNSGQNRGMAAPKRNPALRASSRLQSGSNAIFCRAAYTEP